MNIHRKNQCENPGFRRGGIRVGTWAMSVPSILHPQGMFDLVPVSVPTPSNPRARSIARTPGFTLIELLVVVAVIVMMMTLAIPAFDAMRGGTDFASEVYDINGALEQARAYAMANNTFVLVGIEEVSASQSSSVSAQASGTGTVAVAVVASKDGTRPYQYLIDNSRSNNTPNLAAPGTASITGSGNNYVAVTKLTNFSNIHIVDLQGFGPQAGPTPPSTGNMARPAVSQYYDVADSIDCVSAISFGWPLGTEINGTPAPQYSFAQQAGSGVVIEYDPEGSARIITTSGPGGSPLLDAIPAEIDIGFEPCRGAAATIPISGMNGEIAAIQIDGMSGSVHIYRP